MRAWMLALVAVLAVSAPGLATGAPVSASTAGAPVLAVRALDPAHDQAFMARLPGGDILHAIAVDLDRDGDTDIVASTSTELVVVWLNDGLGRLTRQHAHGVPSLSETDRLGAPFGRDATPGSSTTSRGLAADIDRSPDVAAPPLAPGVARAADQRQVSDRRSSWTPRGPPSSVV